MVEGARLLVLGRQGAGKGTQCERLARHFGVPHISSGDVLRAAVKARTPLGMAAHGFMAAGELVPHTLIVQAIAERLDQPDARDRGFVLDGFPRTKTQAEALFDLLDPLVIDAAVDIDVPTRVVIRRLAARRVCETCAAITVAEAGRPTVVCRVCGGRALPRPDDTAQAIARRLAIYDEETRPLLEWLADEELLITVDGMGSPDDVHRRILAALRNAADLGMAEAG